ncbi:erythromycin esterase family protein [Streptomyces sp. NPDC004667]|uniref:erythromycin esterase family protein n=1 Tax=Streptomyces sp. NPDC004667 TaxID=3154285 RepID=UPI00339E727E
MTATIRDAARPFSGGALTALLSPAPRLLGLGEPTHGVEAFPELRNELFRHLVEHEGYRSIALESDCLAALVADAYVGDGTGTLDGATARGFSHGFGASPANRELLRWMRAYNEGRPAHERLRFYGCDAPLEMTGAASPREALTEVRAYLAARLDLPWSGADLDALLGPDERWTDPAALMDPARSVGRTPEAGRLRLIADDLGVLLDAHAPDLTEATSPEAFWRAALHARTATGLLRYHAGLADTAPGRLGALVSLRDLLMADHLDAIVRREARRGPTLVFAHNGHLQRDPSRMEFAGLPLRWWSAGALVSARLGDRYAFAASAFGSRGTDVPGPDTLEGLLSALPYDRGVIDPGRLAAALDRTPPARVPADHTYAALDPAATGRADALVFVREV